MFQSETKNREKIHCALLFANLQIQLFVVAFLIPSDSVRVRRSYQILSRLFFLPSSQLLSAVEVQAQQVEIKHLKRKGGGPKNEWAVAAPQQARVEPVHLAADMQSTTIPDQPR